MLRHEVATIRRHGVRPVLRPSDRAVLARLSRPLIVDVGGGTPCNKTPCSAGTGTWPFADGPDPWVAKASSVCAVPVFAETDLATV